MKKNGKHIGRKTKHLKSKINPEKEKFYSLDMFPYPSGAGLHVGHPLGYIASDIYSRYKRLQNFEVLHPMGYDSFGLPAEQYAIETGQHPEITTRENIAKYDKQLSKIGFSFDWDRKIQTSDKKYYQWTQSIFISFFNSWYNIELDKAENIDLLIERFKISGSKEIHAACTTDMSFDAHQWNSKSVRDQYEITLNYRMAYLDESSVNWCPELGTVLANDEVKDGRSERGGFPVIQKKMMQWSLRITAYADRLLTGLDTLDWPESIKDVQKNWIGKSQGALLTFALANDDRKITVFTTRADTIFGVSFMVMAPEHPLVASLSTTAQKPTIDAYIDATRMRSERDRISDVKHSTGAFTGAYAIHPLTGDKLPIWIADYVLVHYGTGAIMAVPGGDLRDWNFAQTFNIDIPDIFENQNLINQPNENKEAKLCNSHFLSGHTQKTAIPLAIAEMEKLGVATVKTNFKLRDAGFSRQRYWGEPIPVYFKDGLPYVFNAKELPITLPKVDQYLPTAHGAPPLARAKNWTTSEGYPIETNTMPGWAGSSWYYLRYMDPNNTQAPSAVKEMNYWGQVDLYIGGAEHATGHLLYVRFWAKFLCDLHHIPFDEPIKKLINQGMIQGVSKFVYRKENTHIFISKDRIGNEKVTAIPVDIGLVNGEVLDIERFKNWRPAYQNAEFILSDKGQYICGQAVEKMSKSKYNVINPDELIEKYGADALRLHEMFLGPIQAHKPWNTKGIDGVSRFLRKFWALYHQGDAFVICETPASAKALKVLHKAIKLIYDDMERFSFNTIVSHLMVCVNDLTTLKCNNRDVLNELVILAACHAPHISEELWNKLGHNTSVAYAQFPVLKPELLISEQHCYPISFNGKKRFELTLSPELTTTEVEDIIVNHIESQKWLAGKAPKK